MQHPSVLNVMSFMEKIMIKFHKLNKQEIGGLNTLKILIIVEKKK